MQPVGTPTSTSPQYTDDEIDLFELFASLWKQKLLIALTTLAVTLAGVGYAVWAPPVYQATAHLLPPSSKGTAELRQLELVIQEDNRPRVELKPVPPQDVYEQFLRTLSSYTTRETLFSQPDIREHFTGDSGDELKGWKRFNEAIDLSLPGKGAEVSASVSISADTPEKAADWTNRYVEIAIERSRNQLADDLKEEIQSRIEQLELDISSRQALYDSQIDMELNKLKEALGIAQAMGLQEPLGTDSILNENNDRLMVDEIRRLYRSGARALEAEIVAMEARRKNKAFIPGLTDLQQRKVLLETMTVHPERIQPVKIDMAAVPDDQPIKPKRLLIVALSALLGGMAGVMIALVRTAIINRRQAA